MPDVSQVRDCGRLTAPGHSDHPATPRYQLSTDMVGRREIVRLRGEAAKRLGARFQLEDFHDIVVRAGSPPLPALARTVQQWIARRVASVR